MNSRSKSLFQVNVTIRDISYEYFVYAFNSCHALQLVIHKHPFGHISELTNKSITPVFNFLR